MKYIVFGPDMSDKEFDAALERDRISLEEMKAARITAVENALKLLGDNYIPSSEKKYTVKEIKEMLKTFKNNIELTEEVMNNRFPNLYAQYVFTNLIYYYESENHFNNDPKSWLFRMGEDFDYVFNGLNEKEFREKYKV